MLCASRAPPDCHGIINPILQSLVWGRSVKMELCWRNARRTKVLLGFGWGEVPRWADCNLSAASSCRAQMGFQIQALLHRSVPVCVCWAAGRRCRQLALGELQPASSSEFAHRLYLVISLIPTSLVVFAAFLQCWLSPAGGFPSEGNTSLDFTLAEKAWKS